MKTKYIKSHLKELKISGKLTMASESHNIVWNMFMIHINELDAIDCEIDEGM